ncbi:hypothetical protein M569_06262, partial [Genlisea aurea]
WCHCSAVLTSFAVLGLGVQPMIELEMNGQPRSSDEEEEDAAFELSTIMGIKQNQTAGEDLHLDGCNDKCRPAGSEALPRGIVSTKSNLEMQPLWDSVNQKQKQKRGLLAMTVGIKQKTLVDKIVNKFLNDGFVAMLFHYDGFSPEWEDLEWNDRVIHVSAMKQTKWWFAKRFLHPDIVGEYDYVFLWDEDLGVDHFNPAKYLTIVKEEGLEISQPALDPKSNIHHLITARRSGSRLHRRYYRRGKCEANNTSPPCLGWVEMMAPVFSRSAWRCVWYMIQNDLIHAWGLDFQLGYCAQGDRMQKVGIVDDEYVAHLGIPILG